MKDEGNIIKNARKAEKMVIEVEKIISYLIEFKNLLEIDSGLIFDSYLVKKHLKNNKRRDHHVWLAIEDRVNCAFW
jgi:hypothetical protein